MLAVLLLSAVVAAAYAEPVAIQPHGKTVIHENAKHVHRPVHLLQQVPKVHHRVHTVYNEVPKFVKRVKLLRRTRVHRQYYHVDKPIIEKVTHVKPVILKRPKPYLKNVFVDVPVHRVKNVKVPFAVDVPVPEVRIKKVVRYHENKIRKDVPVVKEKVEFVTVNKPFPVQQVVVQHEPRPRIVLNKRKVHVVRTIHHIKNQPVPIPNVKTVKVEVPHVVKKKIPYPVVKQQYKSYKSYDD